MCSIEGLVLTASLSCSFLQTHCCKYPNSQDTAFQQVLFMKAIISPFVASPSSDPNDFIANITWLPMEHTMISFSKRLSPTALMVAFEQATCIRQIRHTGDTFGFSGCCHVLHKIESSHLCPCTSYS
ncbi:hypothetical protein B0J14DRAFT_72624 [Halenospora varia]|nr:hypothetical protein B0J14DRAFT_72624 [Halenospora varia]